MKQAIFLIAVFFSLSLFAQGKRIYYNYVYSLDSTKTDIKKQETAVLDIGKEGSYFCVIEAMNQDSLKRNKKINNFRYDPFAKSNLKLQIKKNSKSETHLYINFKQFFYNTNLGSEIIWKILPETKKINEYTVQKAETKLFGRIWYAWFSNQIPINDGPYFFHSLPGLIFEVEDNLKSQKFELIEIKNLKKFDKEYLIFPNNLSYKNLININSSELHNVIDNYISSFYIPTSKDPTEISSKYFDINGNQISEIEFFNNKRKQIEEFYKKNNNFLFLDFIKN